MTWRTAVAMTVIGVLAVSLAVVLRSDTSQDGAVDTVPPPAPEQDDATTWEESARAALSAWAQFASSGELAGIDEWFADDGPQHAQILEEAATFDPSGSTSYTFDLGDVEVETRDGFPVVSGRVTVFVNGDVTERLDWDIYLVDRGDRWVVWTVDER